VSAELIIGLVPATLFAVGMLIRRWWYLTALGVLALGYVLYLFYGGLSGTADSGDTAPAFVFILVGGSLAVMLLSAAAGVALGRRVRPPHR